MDESGRGMTRRQALRASLGVGAGLLPGRSSLVDEA